MTLPLVIDSTIIGTFRACETKARLQYVEHLAPSTLSIDLHAGSCIATALETLYEAAYYRGLSRAAALGAMELAFIDAWGDFQIPEWKDTPKTYENCLNALFSYERTYHPPTDHIAPYPDTKAFEWSFGIPLTYETTGFPFPLHPSGDPFIYAGRFDALGLYLGLPVIRDEKTTTQFGKNWPSSWSLRAQFMGYCWAMRHLGIPVECVIIRGIKITKTQVEHQEVEKRFPRHLIDQWLQWLFTNVTRLVEADRTAYWQPSFGTECTNYGGCSFVDLCSSSDPDRWKADFARREWNPLVRGH
jgi:hypothetical protein